MKIPKSIQELLNKNHSPRSIVEYLINCSINRKLELSEVRYIHEYLSKVGEVSTPEEIKCSPCRNMDDLIYRLLELPSEEEIDSFITHYINNSKIPSGVKIRTMSSMKDTYKYMIGKLNIKLNQEG